MANARFIATALSALGLAMTAMPLSAAEPVPVAEAKAPATARLFGRWEIRPNDPFRTEEGPIERDYRSDAASAPSVAIVAAKAPGNGGSPKAADGFEFTSEEAGWQLASRGFERRKR